MARLLEMMLDSLISNRTSIQPLRLPRDELLSVVVRQQGTKTHTTPDTRSTPLLLVSWWTQPRRFHHHPPPVRKNHLNLSKPMEQFETGFKSEPVGRTIYGFMCSVRTRFISVYRADPQAHKQTACDGLMCYLVSSLLATDRCVSLPVAAILKKSVFNNRR